MLASFLVAVISGVFEATLVSLARWWALHPWFPIIARASWWRSTLVGVIQGAFLLRPAKFVGPTT